MPHEKMHRIATCLTAKTIKKPLAGAHTKRRRFFIMKRAQAFVICSTFFEQNIITNEISQVSTQENFLNRFFRNRSTHRVTLRVQQWLSRPQDHWRGNGVQEGGSRESLGYPPANSRTEEDERGPRARRHGGHAPAGAAADRGTGPGPRPGVRLAGRLARRAAGRRLRAGPVAAAPPGRAWPVGATVAWLGGCATLFYVTASGLQTYSMGMFSLHMVQHMVLSMLAPLFLLMGAPVTLALRGLPASPGAAGMPRAAAAELPAQPAGPGDRVPAVHRAAVHRQPLRRLLHPGLRRPDGSTRRAHVHAAALPGHRAAVLRPDPGGRPVAAAVHPRRPDARAAAAGAVPRLLRRHRDHEHTVLLSSYANPPASWGIDPLYDQGAAGGIAWSFGEFPTVLVLAVVFFSWTRSEERANRAADRAYDRAVARGESGEDPALTAYNERLRRLAAQNP